MDDGPRRQPEEKGSGIKIPKYPGGEGWKSKTMTFSLVTCFCQIFLKTLVYDITVSEKVVVFTCDLFSFCEEIVIVIFVIFRSHSYSYSKMFPTQF